MERRSLNKAWLTASAAISPSNDETLTVRNLPYCMNQPLRHTLMHLPVLHHQAVHRCVTERCLNSWRLGIGALLCGDEADATDVNLEGVPLVCSTRTIMKKLVVV